MALHVLIMEVAQFLGNYYNLDAAILGCKGRQRGKRVCDTKTLGDHVLERYTIGLIKIISY